MLGNTGLLDGCAARPTSNYRCEIGDFKEGFCAWQATAL
jgi:hypothetical protein